MDVDSEIVRTHLRRLEQGIAKYLARQIAALTVEKRTIYVRPRARAWKKVRGMAIRNPVRLATAGV